MFKVEKNIAIPNEGAPRRVYPWHDMEKGDSFFVPVDSPYPEKVRCKVVNSGLYHLGAGSVVSRKVPGGFRFWKVKG